MAEEQTKIPYTEILRGVSLELFGEVFGASTRKARETYFHRHGVKASVSVSRLPKPGAKNEVRTAKLFEILNSLVDDEMCEEILRTWLLAKRPLLAGALDHLGIQHENGLTESDDLKKFETLTAAEIKALAKKLEGVAKKDELVLYLKFMGTKNADKVLG